MPGDLPLLERLAQLPAVSAASTPFKGVWTSTDNDGSSQMLTVSAGIRPSVVYQDFYASGCDTFGGPATHWVGAGRSWRNATPTAIGTIAYGAAAVATSEVSSFWTPTLNAT